MNKNYQREYYIKNKERIKTRVTAHTLKNLEKVKTYKQGYYQDNKEEHKVKTKKYYENHKDQVSKHCKEYYEKTKEKQAPKRRQYQEEHWNEHLESSTRWCKANKDKRKDIQRRYAQQYPGKVNANTAKRRAARLQATPLWLTKEHLKQIERYYIVAKWVESILGEHIHVDHIIPLQGENVSGLHVPWNLQLLTEEENCKKSNKVE